jgi:hypothetical protein
MNGFTGNISDFRPKAQVTHTKAAWIRDEGYPIGTPAPGHFICNCGTRVPATETGAICPTCELHFDSQGWIAKESK